MQGVAVEREDHHRARALTRRSSRSPRSRSGHWWIVTVAIAASKLSSSNGSRFGDASIAARRGALRAHRRRRLDRDHVAVPRLVGTRARADVEHGPRVAERRVDERRDPRVVRRSERVARAVGLVVEVTGRDGADRASGQACI